MNKLADYRMEKYFHIENRLTDLPEEFQTLFKEFETKAKNATPMWYVKYAALYFTFEGNPYVITGGYFEVDDENFECIEGELTDRLYELGAYDIFYSGMMD